MTRTARSAPRRMSPQESGRLLLRAQGLATPPGRQRGPEALRRLIHRLGFVQVDSINVLERAHHLILHTRLEHHRPTALATGLETRRTLFEHWTHDASVIPIEFYPHWRPRFRRHAERLERRGWWRERLGEKRAATLLERVLDRVRADGPLRGRDLEEEKADDAGGGWWNWHPGKAALEYHWRTGRLAIAGRQGFEKIYDLSERVFPTAVTEPEPTESEHVNWACRSALERLGVATPAELAAFWESITAADARDWCRDAIDRGEVEKVVLEDLDGVDRSAVQSPATRGWARDAPWDDEFRLLCPFDPVIRDRRRLARRFGFDYRFEAFVPAAKRRYGYYVLPILHGERFVGRLDPRFDREKERIEIRGPWWEPGRGDRGDQRRLARALDRLAEKIGATRGWRSSEKRLSNLPR